MIDNLGESSCGKQLPFVLASSRDHKETILRLLLIPKLEIIGIADVLKFGSRGLSGSARS
jgi:hypothetical protein